jgi:hypothetical protein
MKPPERFVFFAGVPRIAGDEHNGRMQITRHDNPFQIKHFNGRRLFRPTKFVRFCVQVSVLEQRRLSVLIR